MSLLDNRSSEAEDGGTDVQPQDSDRRMRQLSNDMEKMAKGISTRIAKFIS